MAAPATFATIDKLLRDAADVLEVQAAAQASIPRVVGEWNSLTVTPE